MPFDEPLVTVAAAGADAGASLPPAALPAQDVRVLDLTRVLAGPVATRTLALLGADVLRVDAPWLPEADGTHIDTGFGKRTTRLALDDAADRATFEQLLGTADVVVLGYRPGALDRHGLSADALLARHPGLVVAELCAWGWDGPWAGRRGFDSLVQAGTGISQIEGTDDGRPGTLPAQALDHGTGYLVAAAVLRALTTRTVTGAGQHVRLSLVGHRDLAARDDVRSAVAPRRRRRRPTVGWPRPTPPTDGCGTPCPPSASRASRPTGPDHRAGGARTSRAGSPG